MLLPLQILAPAERFDEAWSEIKVHYDFCEVTGLSDGVAGQWIQCLTVATAFVARHVPRHLCVTLAPVFC